jgi:hypothetical protein
MKFGATLFAAGAAAAVANKRGQEWGNCTSRSLRSITPSRLVLISLQGNLAHPPQSTPRLTPRSIAQLRELSKFVIPYSKLTYF